jgi:phosphomannomutase
LGGEAAPPQVKKKGAVSVQKGLMISVSGIRGVVGEGLTPEVVLKFALAFGSMCKSGKVVLGRDSRSSGEMLRSVVVSGLLSTGCKVIDLGICATPTVEIAVEDLKAQGGIIITASHNPIEWNALKFVGSDGLFLSEKENKRLLNLVKSNRINYNRWDKPGKITSDDSWNKRHIDKILKLSFINPQKIRRKKIRVALDCCNGAGGVISPLLLKTLGCYVIELNCKPDGEFAHNPEPVPQNLTSLCNLVKRKKADIGFANDPDVDRLAIVSEKGIPLGEEATLALVTKFILGKKPHSNVAANISTSRMIDDIAKESNSKVYRTRVGEAHVARQLRKVKGIIGGEGNGGVILPKLHYGRDAPVGMALILQYLTESRKTISQLFSELPGYLMIKRKAKLSGNFEKNLTKLKRKYPAGKISTLDGMRIDFENSWLHVRKSNTEPVVRVLTEAKSKSEASRLASEALNMINK